MSSVMTRLGACLSLFACLALAAPATAHSYKAGTLEIGHPWARETPPAAKVGAAYFTVTNTGAGPDKLISVETSGAEKVEIHESIDDNGIARMRQISAMEIPAGKTLELKSGGYHVMLIGLKEPLAEGMRVPATLVFEKAGRIDVELAVESMAYGGPDHHKH